MAAECNQVRENRAAQDEEMEALHYIYGEDCKVRAEERAFEVLVYPEGGPELGVRLVVYFPLEYPASSEPTFQFSASWLSEQIISRLVDGFHDIYSQSGGDVVVFKWIEWMKEQSWIWEEARTFQKPGTPERLKDNSGDKPSPILKPSLPVKQVDVGPCQEEQDLDQLDKILGIVHGTPFTEKKSTFQAHLAPVHSADQVEAVMETLLRNRKVASATHNIMAYRISLSDKATVLQDYDADGETAAGGRLLHLLQIVDAVDVVVVVSRWFGGVLLGPDRFKHINNAARLLLGASGYIKDSTKRSGATTSGKKGRLNISLVLYSANIQDSDVSDSRVVCFRKSAMNEG